MKIKTILREIKKSGLFGELTSSEGTNGETWYRINKNGYGLSWAEYPGDDNTSALGFGNSDYYVVVKTTKRLRNAISRLV